MEKEAVFEIREYVGDDVHEVVGHEVVDISGELEFFERMAKAQEMKEKEELAKKNANPAANGSSASSLPPAQPFSSNVSHFVHTDSLQPLAGRGCLHQGAVVAC